MSEKIYRPNYSDPKKEGFYPVHYKGSHSTICDELEYRDGQWTDEDDCVIKSVEWYLEEIELPSDEEIEKIANDSGAYRVEAGWFIEGFKVAIKGGTK